MMRHALLLTSIASAALAAMGPLLPDTTVLNGCPLLPGQTSACASDRGPFASAAACAAACDAAPYCAAVTYHGPTTQEWATHCVFRIDGYGWAFDPCGSGCDHTASNKTAGFVPGPPPPVPVAPVPWLPALLPWGKPKAFWFGANATGLDSRDTLALLARHAVAGYGWQTGGGQSSGAIGQGDALQAAAATHLADYLDDVGNNATLIFEYRQVQVALRLFAQSAIAADNPANDNFWLHDASSGALCLAGQPWGSSDPYWNFSDAGAADFWVDKYIGQVCADKALAGRGAVFFDGAPGCAAARASPHPPLTCLPFPFLRERPG